MYIERKIIILNINTIWRRSCGRDNAIKKRPNGRFHCVKFLNLLIYPGLLHILNAQSNANKPLRERR
nr:MAG TPA: hypothetical protein [Caudoviricetes sp.]